MSTIPLPALGVQPPSPANPMQGLHDFLAMRAQQNQAALAQEEIKGEQTKNAMAQMQLQDQQNMRTAAGGIDWSQPDAFDKFLSSAQQAKVSPQTLSSLALQRQQYLEQLNKTDVSGLTAMKERGNQLAGHIDAVLNAPPEQKPQVAKDQAQQALDAGLVKDPGVLSFMRSVAAGQVMPTDDQLTHLKNGVLDSTTQADLVLKKQQAKTSASEQGKNQAETEKTNAEMSYYTKNGGAPGVPAEMMQMNDWLKQNPRKADGTPNGPADFMLYKAQHSPTILAQGGMGGGAAIDPMVDMVGQGRVDLGTATQRMAPVAKEAFLRALSEKYPQYNQATYGTTAAVQREFTSGDAAKNLTAFNTAIEHAKQLQSAADALQNGDSVGLNKIGNTLGYQFGSDKTTNFNVIKNALTGEISKVFKGGQATDAEIKAVQDPFNAANSPAQLKGAINNAVALMNSKRDALQQQYQSGTQGKPNFGGTANPEKKDFFSGFGGTQRPQQ
jgi:hypothetical protein